MALEYLRIRPEAIVAISSYYLAKALDGDPDITALFPLLPHGSIAEAWLEETDAGPRVAVRIKGLRSTIEDDDGIRYVDPEWFVLSLALTIYRGHSHIKNISPRMKPGDDPPPPEVHAYHYVYMFRDENGIPWQRLIAGAGSGEDVKLAPEHRDLRMQALSIIPGPNRTYRGREEAIEEALRLYHEAAARGHSLGLSACAYEAMLKFGFKLLDDAHGHKLRREQPIKDAAE